MVADIIAKNIVNTTAVIRCRIKKGRANPPFFEKYRSGERIAHWIDPMISYNIIHYSINPFDKNRYCCYNLF